MNRFIRKTVKLLALAAPSFIRLALLIHAYVVLLTDNRNGMR